MNPQLNYQQENHDYVIANSTDSCISPSANCFASPKKKNTKYSDKILQYPPSLQLYGFIPSILWEMVIESHPPNVELKWIITYPLGVLYARLLMTGAIVNVNMPLTVLGTCMHTACNAYRVSLTILTVIGLSHSICPWNRAACGKQHI